MKNILFHVLILLGAGGLGRCVSYFVTGLPGVVLCIVLGGLIGWHTATLKVYLKKRGVL